MTKKWRLWLVMAASLAAVYFINVEVQSLLGRKALAAASIPFVEWSQALRLQQETNKPVLLYISAIWCPNCRSFDKNVWSDPTFSAYAQSQFILCRMEYEAEQTTAFMHEHQLHGFPNLLIWRAGQIKPLPINLDPMSMLQMMKQQVQAPV